jgi:hypothetical protein
MPLPAANLGAESLPPPNQRLQLALHASHRVRLLRGDCGSRALGGHELIAFVRSCAARFSRRS